MISFDEEQAKVLSIIRMVTAPISIIASTAMIVMISRSPKKLSTTLNRLLVGLSISDIISSSANSFASLPMPKDTPTVWMALGNIRTCEAQGFLYTLGGIASPSYNAGICIFFLLKVRYRMSDNKISTKVEPFLHGIPILTGLTCCVYFLIMNFFNPAASVCFASDYPRHCTLNPNVPCDRGEGTHDNWMVICSIYLMAVIIPCVIFGTMTTLYITVRLQEQRMARYGVGSLTSIRGNTSSVQSRRCSAASVQSRRGSASSVQSHRGSRRGSASARQSRYVKITMHRALAYSGAWLITFIFPAIDVSLRYVKQVPPSYLLRIFSAIFHPLQGFFNFLVFIHPKITLCQAVRSASTTELTMSFFRRNARRSHNSMIVRSVHDAVGNGELGDSAAP